jgi:hypothetical protein
MLGRMLAHLLPVPTAPVHHPVVPGHHFALSWGDVPTWLAAIASRPRSASLRDGFASLDPAPTRKDLAPERKPSGSHRVF